jgi:hypothetical protein
MHGNGNGAVINEMKFSPVPIYSTPTENSIVNKNVASKKPGLCLWVPTGTAQKQKELTFLRVNFNILCRLFLVSKMLTHSFKLN